VSTSASFCGEKAVNFETSASWTYVGVETKHNVQQQSSDF
jgi:hypothetical protein